ncbi:porin [Paraburkholderia tropica]|uniref:porin n=1 Tax=Paraburkholderia tropica TaxID=92647 RepID=UPI002AB7444A|nr:porin [Paraburkholderia tropica]
MKNRQLTCLAISALYFSGAAAYAQSSVTLYGVVDAGFNYFSNSHGTKGHVNFASGGDYADRWGVKGREDLGGGLSAIFTLENGFNIGTGNFSSSGTEFNRQAFMGLSSDRYGTLTFGRQYSTTTDLLENYGPDLGSGGIATYPGDMSDVDNSVLINNSVKYRSPTINGLTGELIYGFGNVSGSLSTGSTATAGFSYVTGPWFLAATYFRSINATPNTTAWSGSANAIPNASLVLGFNGAQSVQIANAVADYTFGKWTAGLNYGYTQYRPGGGSTVFTHPVAFNSVGAVVSVTPKPDLTLGLGYNFTFGQSVDAESNAATPRVHQIGGRAIYLLSKRTGLYMFAGYSHANGTTLNSTATGVVPVTANLGDTANGAWSSSRNQAIVKVGMYNRF